jgi:hypothetical protein
LINLLEERVRHTVISSIQKAKYYSFVFDTIPDNANVEKMSQTVRFIEIQRDLLEMNEVFIDFNLLDVKTAQIITEEITNKLGRAGLNLEDCRSQSYDNQATMADVYSGVQKRNFDLNPLAVFIPRNNYSLSLVGLHAAHVNVQALTFFYCEKSVWLLFMFNSPGNCCQRVCRYYTEAPF